MENKTSIYQDQVYNYKGLWDLPSICGLKIVKKENETIVIVTDLFQENPGTPITEWSTKLAKEICEENDIEYSKLVYIEHTPDKDTKLTFNHQSFFKVNFDISEGIFENPKWKELNVEEVNKLLNE